MPLVTEARNWMEGVYMAATMGSETTAAAFGAQGVVRRDPFAMLPFCGYNMADYFAHWLKVGEQADAAKLPKVFYVNWFRKDEDGKFMWPGFGENSRVLEWVFRRCDGGSAVEETAIGYVPAPGELNTEGLDIDEATVDALLHVDEAALVEELGQIWVRPIHGGLGCLRFGLGERGRPG